MASLRKLPYLRGLTLEEVPVSYEGLRHLAAIKGLENLNLMSTGMDDARIQALSGMKSLRFLSLQDSRLTDAAMEFLTSFPVLQDLDLARTKVTDNGVNTFLRSSTLWNVSLDHTGVSDEKAKELALHFVQNRMDIPVAAKTQISTNPDAPKVGIYLSHYTATGPHWMPQRYGYNFGRKKTLLPWLAKANFDLYAVVEKDTEMLGDLPQFLADYGLSTKTVEATDRKALLELDVIVADSVFNVLDEGLGALDFAVSNGVGLFIKGSIGIVTPQYESSAIEKLYGFSESGFLWWAKGPMAFDIVAEHPILADLKPGTAFAMPRYNGCYDTTGATPLDGTILIDSREENGVPFAPLFVRDHGKGRVVVCAWLYYEELEDWPHATEEFYTRCVNWAAKESVDTEW